MLAGDGEAVLRVYGEGIETGHATFETAAPDWDSFDRSHLATCRFVADADGTVVGWAALSPVSSRCVYSGVAEVSVYVARAARGQGVGEALLTEVVAASEREGIWTLQAGVFPENEASLRLHQKAGFRILGVQERVGCMQGVWRDVVLLERRSKVAGT